MYSWFRVLERGYAHYRQGYIDPGEWDGHTRNLASVMRSEAVQKWWIARKSYFGREFAAMLDDLETEGAAPALGEVAAILAPSRQPEPPATE
jgi:hypothetical protein